MERQLRCLAFGVCRPAAPVSVRTSGPCLSKAGPENTRRVRLPLRFSGTNSHSFGAQLCIPAQRTLAIVKRELLHFED